MNFEFFNQYFNSIFKLCYFQTNKLNSYETILINKIGINISRCAHNLLFINCNKNVQKIKYNYKRKFSHAIILNHESNEIDLNKKLAISGINEKEKINEIKMMNKIENINNENLFLELLQKTVNEGIYSINVSQNLSHFTLQSKWIKETCIEFMKSYPTVHSLHFDSFQRERFLQVIQHQKSANNNVRILIGLVNKHLTNQLNQEISQEKKDLLQDWIRVNGIKIENLSQKEMKEAMELFGFSKSQLRQQLKFLSENSGEITENVKQIVRNWLINHNNESPNSKDRDELQKLTKLSRTQLNNLIYRIREPLGDITDEVKQKIHDLLIANNFRQPTRNEIELLQLQTGLNRPQLFNLIFILKNNSSKITLKDNEKGLNLIKDWYSIYKRQPNLKERSILEKESELSWRQIYELIRRLEDNSNSITPQLRLQIFEKLQEINFESPSSNFRDDLQQKTGLGRAQLNKQIQLIRQRYFRSIKSQSNKSE